MKKMIVVHVYADRKFVSEIAKYESKHIENRLIFLGDEFEVQSMFSGTVSFYLPQKNQINNIVAACIDADLVVINELDDFKAQIALQLPKNKKIAWRFYGYELYAKIRAEVTSKATQEILNQQGNQLSIMSEMRRKIVKRFPIFSVFHRAMNRCDYFIGVIEEEYVQLLARGFKLPTFLPIPINYRQGALKAYAKEPFIIVGNSRSYYNNHMDILRIVRKVQEPMFTIKLFFNYGSDSSYAATIRGEANKIPGVEIIETFLSKDEFEAIYQRAAALVINGYRQMALGNIFAALKFGTKVYLSEKNPAWKWLRDNEIQVFSVENQFADDLNSGNLVLPYTTAYLNAEAVRNMADRYTPADFQESILKSIKAG